MSELIERDFWGALLPRKFTSWQPDKIDTIVVHWLGYQPGPQHYTQGVLDEHDLIASIQHDHMFGRGWNDIAYNLLVGQEQVYEGRGIAHRNGANRPTNKRSISICALLTTGSPDPSDALLDTLQEAIWWVTKRVPSIKHVRPHKRIAKTSCPGAALTEMIRTGDFTLQRPAAPAASSAGVDMSWIAGLTPELMWHRICGVKDVTILNRFNELKQYGRLSDLRAYYLSIISDPEVEWLRDTRNQSPDAVPPHPRHDTPARTNDDAATTLMKQYGLSTQQQLDLWDAFKIVMATDGTV